MQQLKSVRPRNIRFKAKIEQHTLYYQLLDQLIKRQYGEVIQLAPQIKTCLARYEDFLSINRRLTFLYNLGVAYFLEAISRTHPQAAYEKLLQESLDWFNLIENEAKFETRRDVKKFTKTLTTIIHFELDDLFLVESKINMGIRYLKKENIYNSGEGLVFKCLQKVINTNDKKEQEILFRKLYQPGPGGFHGMEELRKWVGKKFT